MPAGATRRLDALRLWRRPADQEETVEHGSLRRRIASVAGFGAVASSVDALPPGTRIAVQLDARGGRLHEWLTREVTGARMSLTSRGLGFQAPRPFSRVASRNRRNLSGLGLRGMGMQLQWRMLLSA